MYDNETLSIDGASDKEHFYKKIMQNPFLAKLFYPPPLQLFLTNLIFIKEGGGGSDYGA